MNDVIVYKYRDWTNEFHKKVLLANQLYLSSPADMNDPFDCKIPTNFALLDTPEKINQYADEYLNRHRANLIRKGIEIDVQKLTILNGLSNEMEFIQESNAKKEFQDSDNHNGVLSLTYRWDSILMWSHYSCNHKGFCVGFYREKLIKSGLFGKGGDVNYHEKFPEINPLGGYNFDKSFIETHNKALDWGYEKEYRLTKTFYPNIPSLDDRTVVFQDEFMAELLLGLKITEEHRNAIIEIAKAKGVKVYQLFQVPFRFQLDRKEIT